MSRSRAAEFQQCWQSDIQNKEKKRIQDSLMIDIKIKDLQVMLTYKMLSQHAVYYYSYFLLSSMEMNKSRSPLDENLLMRYFHLHTIKYIIKLASLDSSSRPQEINFPQPRFELFRPLPPYYKDERDRYKLFKNIMLGFRWEVCVGILFTVIYASLNLLLSQIIKEFIQTMQRSESVREASGLTQKFILLQLLRMVFGAHMKRLFEELAIQIESTIAKRLIKKSLHLDPAVKRRIPETQIYQLQNVDLKLIYNLFTVLYLGCEIPFTIGVTIIWLFYLNLSLGVIALYWFLVVFLVQRALDDRMKLCNLTKLGLIDKRSKLNYEFLQKIRQARIVHAESLMVQKNNDFFLDQCHDHFQFYRYSVLYDIAQLLLPIAVVVTVLIYDKNSQTPLTVEQLYLILSLLGICYRPMKEFRTLTIALSDGMHSLRRISDYFQLPEERVDPSHYYQNQQGEPSIKIQKHTVGKVQGRGIGIELDVSFNIEAKAGERIVVLGRRGQGSSTLLNIITGLVPITHGSLRLGGRIAYLSQSNFIIIDTLYKNLAFYDNSITLDEAHQVCVELELYEELQAGNQLEEDIEPNKYNENQLKMVSLARLLCSKAKVYVLDTPYAGLTSSCQARVEKILRARQAEGVITILALKTAQAMRDEDIVVILNVAITKEVSRYGQMLASPRSYISNFIQNRKAEQVQVQSERAFRRAIAQFQNKVRKAMMYSVLFQKQSQIRLRRERMNFLISTLQSYTKNIYDKYEQKQKMKQEIQHEKSVHYYFLKFLNSCKLSQSAYILIIIIACEVLHIFIHFYIGHEYEHRARSGIKALSSLMLYQMVLTLGLAGLIYIEGEVSSYLAFIAGNKLYKESLESLVHRQIRWYGEEYSLRTADKFNHDYEQIFILVHQVLNLYKNAVILIATALFVGGSHYIVLMMTIAVGALYFSIWQLVRKAHSCILKRYYDYKYEFVKVFHESLEGGQLMKVYGVRNQVLKKAELKYTNLASYKLAANYANHGQFLLCDIAAMCITALALQFGTEVEIDRKSISGLATSILLLLNLADVLKAILDSAVQVQIFFRLNILPFMEIVPINTKITKVYFPSPPKTYDITFDSVMMKEPDEEIFEIYPLQLKIPHGQSVCLYEEDQICRNNLLYGLTRNLTTVADRNQTQRNVFVGGVPVCNIASEDLRRIFGVIINDNFFLTGTLEQNLKWRCLRFDEQKALKLCKALGVGEDLKRFKDQGLKARIQQIDEQNSQGLSKKIAMMRIILHQCPIVIIMDTPSFVGRFSINQILRKYNKGCTIIKITNSLEVAFDMSRIVLLQHLEVVEEGNPKKLVQDKLSKIGQMLRMCNEETYIYRNRVSINPRNFNKKDYDRIAMRSKSKSGKKIV